MIESFGSVLTAVGLGVGAGVNAYATFLVFGLLSRFYPAMFHGDAAEFFASTPVLIVVGVMYAIEFVADKFPVIDHAWDAVHTFIRPLAGAIVAFASASPDVPAGIVILATILGGGAALGSHAVKATVRATSTATTAGAANPIISSGRGRFRGGAVSARDLPAVRFPDRRSALRDPHRVLVDSRTADADAVRGDAGSRRREQPSRRDAAGPRER